MDGDKKVIGFLIGSLSKGGAERVIVNLAEYFTSIGYKSYIITKHIAENEYTISKDITRLNGDIEGDEISSNRVINFFRRVRKLRRIWIDIKADIVLSLIGKNNHMNILSTRGLKTKVAVSVAGEPRMEYPGKYMLLANLLFPKADGIMLQTEESAKSFARKVRKKAIILKSPLNEEFVIDNPSLDRKKEIVSVGRLDDNKNQIMLIKAFLQIAENHKDWNCILYGDGESRSKIYNYIEEQSIGNRVILKGAVDNVSQHISSASIFVLTSKSEGYPNALVEAMALGIAVISTDCPSGGPAELISNEVNGILVGVDDEQGLRDAIVKLIVDEKMRKKLGANAYESAKVYYPKTVLNEWRVFLEGL